MLHYMPFWVEPWFRDYQVQALPRHVRLIFYDLLFTLWTKEMVLQNDDKALSYYLRISQEEWIDAKRILLQHDFIQLVQGAKFITNHRLGLSHEHVSDTAGKNATRAQNAAQKRWSKHR
jgi:uncharacterized protein YdaU (DUF1376 family)